MNEAVSEINDVAREVEAAVEGVEAPEELEQTQKGKWALITGASSGIGEALAHEHAKVGGNVIAVARHEDKLLQLKAALEEKYGVEVLVVAQDLTEDDACKSLAAVIDGHDIEVEYLMNNAGFGGRGEFHKRDLEKDLAMIQLNVVAVAALTHIYLPRFVARGSGRILNTSSVAGIPPGGPLQATYFATKAFVTSFSNAISEELKGTGVTVTCLLPGGTESNFAEKAGISHTKLVENSKTYPAEDVAAAGYQGMLKGRLDVWAGCSIGQRVALRLSNVVPKSVILSYIHKSQELVEAE